METRERDELLVWLKDGEYRLKILQVLQREKLLSSEIAEKISNHRSTTSRILKDLMNKGLAHFISSNSRTRMYYITDKGKELLNCYYGKN